MKYFITIMVMIIGFQAFVMWPVESNNSPTCPQWIKNRHKYHGINGSIEYRGEHYFYRDGKKCKL